MFEWIRKSRQVSNLGLSTTRAPRARNYAAAQLSRLMNFRDSLEVAHKERLRDIAHLRSHSRDLNNNNVYAARYNELVSTNLVGPEGVNFESEILGKDSKPKEDWNNIIEESFLKWGKCCTADGRLAWVEAQQLAAISSSQDGEILIRKIFGYPNEWGFAIEMIDADRLDHTYNTPLPSGSRIVGGVEMDQWGRRLAYWIWSAHPTDYEMAPVRVRIPADQIIHLYREDRTQGVRGIPWITPCMVQINLVGRLWNAELLASNHEADRLGIIKSQSGLSDTEIDDCRITAEEISSDHATFLGLDSGQDISFPTVQHPNSILPAFTSYLLKGIASGVGVAYHSLTGDLAESKFSSDRTALIQERDHWRKLQGWFIRSFNDPIYRAWLEMALLSGAVKLPASNFEMLCAPHWDARSWDWVDPVKDVEASRIAIRDRLSTHQRELSQQGLDWQDVFRQCAIEDAFALELAPASAPVANADGGAVQDTALNGAQVSSLLEIINAITAGTMPKATAEALIPAAFPGMDPDQVSAMLSPIVEGSAKPVTTTISPSKEDSNAADTTA